MLPFFKALVARVLGLSQYIPGYKIDDGYSQFILVQIQPCKLMALEQLVGTYKENSPLQKGCNIGTGAEYMDQVLVYSLGDRRKESYRQNITYRYIA